MASYYYNVCLNRPAARLKSAYTYSYETKISIGTLVQVLFHGRRETGVIISSPPKPTIAPSRVLALQKVLSPQPAIAPRAIRLAEYLACYYLASIGEVIFAMLPGSALANKMPLALDYFSASRPSQPVVITGNFNERMTAYLPAVNAALARGGQILHIAPNRRLSKYVYTYWQNIFSAAAVVDTSSIKSNPEQLNAYRQIAEGRINIVVGTRKTIFSPLKHLALIIVEEPSNFGYYNDQKPAYNLRVVAETINELYRTPIHFGMGVLDEESLWRVKHGHCKLRRGRASTQPEAVWMEGDYRQEIDRRTQRAKLVVVPFAKGKLMQGNFAPEKIAQEIKSLPVQIVAGGATPPDLTRAGPLALVAGAKIVDYPELIFEETVILAADIWLSFPTPHAIGNFLRLYWRLRAQTKTRFIIHSRRPLPLVQKLIHQPPAKVLVALMKQNHQLDLPPFTHRLVVDARKPAELSNFAAKAFGRSVSADGALYVPRRLWPLGAAAADRLYSLSRKITIDAPR